MSRGLKTGQAESVLRDWVSRAELATQIGVSVDTLCRWDSEGVGPASVRIGRNIVYRRETVAKWLSGLEAESMKQRSGGFAA